MTRTEIIEAFREENPEITSRVIADTTLNSWLKVGNMETCIKARLIKGEGSFSSVIGSSSYNLTAEIPNFYDIDDLPGGGVVYDGEPIDLTTKAEQNERDSTWRSNSNGTPEYYWLRNNFIFFEKPPISIKTVLVDCVLFPDDFDSDNETPYNQLTTLTPFHYAMVLYLIYRAKGKLAKMDEKVAAKLEYNEYIEWMKKEINRGTMRSIQLKPKKYYS